MATRTVYQTLENKGTPNSIENDGPFPCNRKNAWLGQGYYFWESFIENAHWWGSECNNYANGYVICRAFYTESEEKCFNLIDNPNHFRMLNQTIDLMETRGLYQRNKTTVSRIIEYLRNTLHIFTFEATRVYGVNSKSLKSDYSKVTIFSLNQAHSYLDSLPAIQICFYTKKSLNLNNYKIVYPDEYIDGYMV